MQETQYIVVLMDFVPIDLYWLLLIQCVRAGWMIPLCRLCHVFLCVFSHFLSLSWPPFPRHPNYSPPFLNQLQRVCVWGGGSSVSFLSFALQCNHSAESGFPSIMKYCVQTHFSQFLDTMWPGGTFTSAPLLTHFRIISFCLHIESKTLLCHVPVNLITSFCLFLVFFYKKFFNWLYTFPITTYIYNE